MSFPIEIKRGVCPSLVFPDLDSLRAWVAVEIAAWAWLVREDGWDSPLLRPDHHLAEQAMEAQLSASQELQGLLSGGRALSDEAEKAIEQVLIRAYRDGKALATNDPGTTEILSKGTAMPAYALGMLAQALELPVESQSASAFAGRRAWLEKLPGELTATATQKIEDMNQRFDAVEELLKGRQQEPALQEILRELRRARRISGTWMAGLAASAMLWLFLAGYALWCVHRLITPGLIDPEWKWFLWSERLALYLFVIGAFSWGMRWIGRMLSDAWAAGQSAARRYTALKVVLDDKGLELVKRNEKDRERFRAEIFGDLETPASSDNAAPAADKLEFDQVGKILDLAKEILNTASKGIGGKG